MKETLNWQDIRALGKTDSAGRWYPNEDIAEYFKTLRAPSRAYPHSEAQTLVHTLRRQDSAREAEFSGKGSNV